ncbi:MAG: hypothetical protein ACLFN2_07735 [Bacteroidales bacterium]
MAYHTRPGPPPLAQMMYMMSMMDRCHFALIMLFVLFGFFEEPFIGAYWFMLFFIRAQLAESPGCFPGLSANWNYVKSMTAPFNTL